MEMALDGWNSLTILPWISGVAFACLPKVARGGGLGRENSGRNATVFRCFILWCYEKSKKFSSNQK